MRDDDPDVDLSIRLEPVAATVPIRKSSGSHVAYLLVGFAVLLSVAVIAAVAFKLATSLNPNVSVTAERSASFDRAEAVSVFNQFDAIEDRRASRPPAEQHERETIATWFHELESCVGAKDQEKFRGMIDFDRLLKRIEMAGDLHDWTRLEKRMARNELRSAVVVSPFWSKIVVVGMVAPPDDLDTRVVYAYGSEGPDHEETPNRFWLCRARDSWRLYDWERIDLGLSKSEQWGAFCRYRNTYAMDGFHRWAELISEADECVRNNDVETAKSHLREAESQSLPTELQDYCATLTGNRWGGLNELADAERCYEKVKVPDDTPGAFFSLMDIKRMTSASDALKYAESYEAVVGVSPAILNAKAQIFEKLHRKPELVDTLKTLLRLQPENDNALEQLYFALPKDKKGEFEAQLERLEDPAPTVVRVATSLGYRDYPELLRLGEYLNRKAPNTAAALELNAFAKNIDGNYAEAADLFRRASEAETDADKKYSHSQAYIDAMIQNGDVIAALKSAPDAKSTFESIFSNYDEGESTLTDEEYRQVVDLCLSQFPDDLDAVDRKARLAIDQHHYDEAERILRDAIAKTPAAESDGATDSDQDHTVTISSGLTWSLATVLFKQGRINEAYELPGDKNQRVDQLARLANDAKHWDDLQKLLELRRADDPDCSQVHYLQGELAARVDRWSDAESEFKQAIATSSGQDRKFLESRLQDASIKSDQVLTYYGAAENPNETFTALANKLCASKNWQGLQNLIDYHSYRSRTDGSVAKYEALSAWEQGQYAKFATLADGLLNSTDASVLPPFQRAQFERRRLSALLRSNQLFDARLVADEKQRTENDARMLAIVNAVSGNIDQAKRQIREMDDAGEEASYLYSDDDAGPFLLGEDFRDLQREFPVRLPYNLNPTLAVFLFDTPFELEAADITAAIKAIGVETTATPQPLTTSDKTIARAFALRFDKASVVLVSGSGKFDKGWELEDGPLAEPVNNTKAWLAVTSAAWTEPDRKTIADLARRLSSQLVDDRAKILCAREADVWVPFSAYPATQEVVAKWASTGDLRPFEDLAIVLTNKGRKREGAVNREFKRAYHAAVQKYESAPQSKLVVLGSIGFNMDVDMLPLEVSAVARQQGGLEFEGALRRSSLLISQLKAGLPMKFQDFVVQGFRLNDDAPVYRQ